MKTRVLTVSHTKREKEKLLNRVRRVRGQVEAVERALEGEKGCAAVLHLIVAARGAMNSLMTEVIEDHIRLHVVDPAKDVWKRQRPHLFSDLVRPVVPLSKSGSYPSGHATVGTLMGVELSNMIPEKRAAIMARAWEFGHNRIVGGIHYASDIEMGRISGMVIAQTISTHADFKDELEAAKAELRAALGLN